MDEFEISKFQSLPVRIFPAETSKLKVNQALFFFFANGLKNSPLTIVNQGFKYVEIKDTAFNYIDSDECGLMYYGQMPNLKISLNKVALRSVSGHDGIIRSTDTQVSSSINAELINCENTFDNPSLISAYATTSLATSNFTKSFNEALTLYVIPSEKIKYNSYYNISSKESSPL